MEALVLDIQPTVPKVNGYLLFSVQIVEQLHRGGIANYTTSKGFSFLSMSLPALSYGHNTGYTADGEPVVRDTLYLRGSAHDKDNEVLHTKSVRYITRLQEAVIEYNKSKGVVD